MDRTWAYIEHILDVAIPKSDCTIGSNWIDLSLLVHTVNGEILCLQYVSKYRSMIILSGYIGVDTFFVLSGLLASIAMLKHLQKT